MGVRLRIVLLLGLSVLPHLAVWNADFTFDDREFVQANASIRSLPAALDAFDDSFPPESKAFARYRPLTNLSYAMQYSFWREDPRGYHRVNLLLYFAVVCLVYRVALGYLGSPAAATATAALFALHPVHSEAVDSIAGHSELLSLFFALASLLSFHVSVGFAVPGEPATPRRRTTFGLVALACFALALLAKESALMLAPVVVLHLLLHNQPAGERSWAKRLRPTLVAAPFALMSVAYLGLRIAVLGRLRPEVTVLGDADLVTRFLTVGRVFAEYVRLLIFPYPLQVDYYYQHTVGVHDAWTWSAGLGWLALLLLAIWTVTALWAVAIRRDPTIDPSMRTVLFGALFAGAFLFPVSHVVPFGALMAERFLFAPSVGFCLVVGALGLRFVTRFRGFRGSARLAVAVALATSLTLMTAVRAAEWRDSVTLWRPVVERLPEDHRAWANLGRGHLRRGETALAMAALGESLKRAPTHVSALNNLAAIHLDAGDYGKARTLYRRALDANPESAVAWTNLGLMESRLLNHAASRNHYRRALALNANYASARERLRVADAMVLKAEGFLSQHEEWHPETAPLGMLRQHVLSRMVVDDQQGAAELYAILLRRSGGADVSRIPQLEAQIPALAGTR